jgi:hypothetical protein
MSYWPSYADTLTSCVYPYLWFIAFFQAPVQPGVPLIDDCSAPSHVIATLETSDPVQVRFSLAQAPQTCYAVTAEVEGKPVKGYVLGPGLKAIADFENARPIPVAPAAAVPAPAVAAPSLVAAVPAVKNPAPAQPSGLPVFADFSGRDLHGKPVGLSAVKGKVILVCFWSPHNTDSLHEATLVTRLVGQLRQQGVNAVTVGLSADRELMGEAAEAIVVPSIFNGYEIAARSGVTFEALPRTYILNEKHEILASGLHGQQLENRVRSLASGK